MITKQMVDKARSKNVWTLGNKILYDLCAKNPGHTEVDVIVAKIWLIGRSYASAIERVKIKRPGVSDFYLEVAAPEIKKSKIDSWLQSLNGRKLGQPAAPDILSVHRELTDLFQEMTDLNKRSLASKYLHFHFPHLFFIYDSRVVKAFRRLSPMIGRVKSATPDDDCDNEYRKVFEKCLILRNQIRKMHGITLSPRQLDSLLLGLALTEEGGLRC